MRKPTFGQRRGKPVPAGEQPASGQPVRKRHSRLDADFPEGRGSIAGSNRDEKRGGRSSSKNAGSAGTAATSDGGKRWTKRVRPNAIPKSAPTPDIASIPSRANPDAATQRKSARPALPPGSGRPTETMRVAKAMARAGLCSRREAERWIEEGRVSVNGSKISSPALDVHPRDRIVVDGEPMPDAEPARLWRYHKPRGLVTTHKDPEGRPTVFDHLPPDLPRVVSIGRLDYNTEGLLLLTNDGELARHLELPSTGWLRKYRVRAHGSITQAKLDELKNGIEIEGVRYGPIEATLDTTQGRNSWLTLGLREGKNREVRNILGSLELVVNRLIRISYGPFQLMDLDEGKAESIKRRVLADQLGPELTKQFHLEPPPETAAPTKPRKPRF
jgi:23S rRNA pseudouridine2605 synthase